MKPASNEPERARRAWLPRSLFVVWLIWIAFLAWQGHTYWGVPRPVPLPVVKTGTAGP